MSRFKSYSQLTRDHWPSYREPILAHKASLDCSDSLLRKPVHGLIFLYQYVEEDREDDLPDCPDNVWFANQVSSQHQSSVSTSKANVWPKTTDNACATVALLNIVMNGKDIKLGKKLEEFKKATQDLSAPIRGHALSANLFIRTTHNSLARRLDLLNADLMLLNEYDDSKKKRARFTKGRKQKSVTEAAFHFIAYVPTADGKIWELDGLQSDPVCLGQYSDDWTAVVRPIIEARMLQYESDNMSFNLLALCRTPLDTLRQELVTNIRKLLTLEKRILEIPEMSSIAASERTWLNGDDETSLAEYGVSKEDLTTAAAPQSFKDKISKPSFETAEALDLQQSLEDEQKRIRSEYVAELAATDEDEARVLGRKKDYAPAIHEWVKKLAEHGVLQELINNV